MIVGCGLGDDRTGAANPYAMAELVAGHAIDWARVSDPVELLQELLRTPYQDLFKDDGPSPLYASYRPPEGLVEWTVGGHASWRVSSAWETLFCMDSMRSDAGWWESLKSRLATPWGCSPSWRTTHFGTMDWHEVRQVAGTCYFLAPLVSLLFTGQTPVVKEGTAGEPHRFGMHPDTNGIVDYEVDGFLPFEGVASVFASSLTSNESWPGLFEKAYASVRLGRYEPRPCAGDIACGSPRDAFLHLSGRAPDRFDVGSSSSPALDAIRDRCDHGGRLRSAMVVSTKRSSDIARPDDSIVPSHAYAVLGCGSAGNSPFVILYNPWAKRDITPRRYPLPALSSFSWLPADARDIRNAHTGVIPVLLSTFEHCFRYMYVLDRSTP